MPKPCRDAHPAPVAGCRVCELYETSPEHRRVWDRVDTVAAVEQKALATAAAAGEPVPPPARVALACVHEGPVIEWAPCDCESKHVRVCLHPEQGSQIDLCTRVTLYGAILQGCDRCAFREEVK